MFDQFSLRSISFFFFLKSNSRQSPSRFNVSLKFRNDDDAFFGCFFIQTYRPLNNILAVVMIEVCSHIHVDVTKVCIIELSVQIVFELKQTLGNSCYKCEERVQYDARME